MHQNKWAIIEVPIFSWAVNDKYVKLLYFENEVNDISITKDYALADKKSSDFDELALERGTPLHTNSNKWRKRNVEQQDSLLKILNKKFKQQHNETILSLQ